MDLQYLNLHILRTKKNMTANLECKFMFHSICRECCKGLTWINSKNELRMTWWGLLTSKFASTKIACDTAPVKKKSLHNTKWNKMTALYLSLCFFLLINLSIHLLSKENDWINWLIQIHAPTCHNYAILSHRNDHSNTVFRWLPNVYQLTSHPSFIQEWSCDLWLAVHLPSIKITNWTLFSRCSRWCWRLVAYPGKTSENGRFAWKKPTSKPMTKTSPLLILYHRQHPLFLHKNGRTKNEGHRTDHVAMWYISPKTIRNMYINEMAQV